MRIEDSSLASQNSALTILAQETETTTEEVLRIYENELASLEANARVRFFVPALALRRVRAKLHKRRHSDIRR